MSQPDPVREEREAAWLGDAVLSLYARRWVLARTGRMDQEMFAALTSNHFLSTIGPPTAVEARIGRAYQSGGLDAAFVFIAAEVLPRFLAQEKNRRRR